MLTDWSGGSASTSASASAGSFCTPSLMRPATESRKSSAGSADASPSSRSKAPGKRPRRRPTRRCCRRTPSRARAWPARRGCCVWPTTSCCTCSPAGLYGPCSTRRGAGARPRTPSSAARSTCALTTSSAKSAGARTRGTTFSSRRLFSRGASTTATAPPRRRPTTVRSTTCRPRRRSCEGCLRQRRSGQWPSSPRRAAGPRCAWPSQTSSRWTRAPLARPTAPTPLATWSPREHLFSRILTVTTSRGNPNCAHPPRRTQRRRPSRRRRAPCWRPPTRRLL
mmetsp:Transcript_31271/g.105211  ORF Transcript_31271/g.105211 Transcript_31271/m.105211 type:complete len:281 (+) Transcript_31271:883-1725(+)